MNGHRSLPEAVASLSLLEEERVQRRPGAKKDAHAAHCQHQVARGFVHDVLLPVADLDMGREGSGREEGREGGREEGREEGREGDLLGPEASL